jgi:hypothetical protein
MKTRSVCLLVATVVLTLAPAMALAQGESVGMITEIKVGKGRVEVMAAGKPDARPAGPFLALRVGDTIRATDNAFAVILLTGGRGTVKVEASNSPFVLAAGAPGDSKLKKVQTLMAGSVGFLAANAGEPPKAVLSVRAGVKPAVILTPRDTAVLPGPLTFEWLGTQFARYTVRVSAPSGVLLEKKGVVGARFEYPAAAPALKSGVRYTLVVEPATGAAQQTSFEVVDATRAAAMRQNLEDLADALGPTVPWNTAVAIRAGTLAREGLLHDARQVVMAALAKDPDEPSLHTLLGQIYEKSGLPEQAAESFDEAQFLLTKGAN